MSLNLKYLQRFAGFTGFTLFVDNIWFEAAQALSRFHFSYSPVWNQCISNSV